MAGLGKRQDLTVNICKAVVLQVLSLCVTQNEFCKNPLPDI